VHPRLRFCRLLGLLAVLAACAGRPAAGQGFGSSDDPREEIRRVWWKRENSLYALGGVSLIGAQWHAAGNLTSDVVTRSLTARLSGTLRAGYFGEYGPDLDETYDVLRLVQFARYDPPGNTPLHLRLGPIERLRLGTGHVVNFFGSSVAWDERTVGAEAMLQSPLAEVGVFTDNVSLDGVVGGRVAVQPFLRSKAPRLPSLRVGLNYVADLARRPAGARRLEAFNVDAQVEAFSSGDIAFSPFASYAWYPGYGRGVGFGADLHSEDFIDLFSFRLRMALYYNGQQFLPGYVGSFYTVHNLYARILDADGGAGEGERLAGLTLPEARGGNDLVTELRVAAPARFELWYYFRRHYGTVDLSELHFRVFLRSGDQMRLDVGIDRGGLEGLLSVFDDMDDLSALVFATHYRVAGPLWLFLQARYGYERVDADDPGDDGDRTQRFLVQRRFEPMSGLRLNF
jgi:hypothetical protein